MNELKSYTEYAVSTPTADFVIGFDFNYGEDAVNVTVDDVPATEAGYTVVYLNETTIRLSPSVPSGVVRLQRETDIDQTDHAYRAGAKFIAQTMDENFEQLRHSQQEVRDGFVKLANDTYEIIDTLEDVGKSAQDAADAAEVAAELANNAAAQVNDKVSYEDFNNKPHNAMLGRDAEAAHPTSSILDASGETQQKVNYNGGSKWHSRVGGYKENERVTLTNGDIVKSTVDGNTNDPNADMTGWAKTNSASQIFDASGKNQQEVNNGLSTSSLKAIQNSDSLYYYNKDKQGYFEWKVGNYSAMVTLDKQEGIYIPSNFDPSGSQGVWKRVFDGKPYAKWFGVLNDDTNLQGAVNVCKYFGGVVFESDSSLTLTKVTNFDGLNNFTIEGNGVKIAGTVAKPFSINNSVKFKALGFDHTYTGLAATNSVLFNLENCNGVDIFDNNTNTSSIALPKNCKQVQIFKNTVDLGAMQNQGIQLQGCSNVYIYLNTIKNSLIDGIKITGDVNSGVFIYNNYFEDLGGFETQGDCVDCYSGGTNVVIYKNTAKNCRQLANIKKGDLPTGDAPTSKIYVGENICTDVGNLCQLWNVDHVSVMNNRLIHTTDFVPSSQISPSLIYVAYTTENIKIINNEFINVIAPTAVIYVSTGDAKKLDIVGNSVTGTATTAQYADIYITVNDGNINIERNNISHAGTNLAVRVQPSTTTGKHVINIDKNNFKNGIRIDNMPTSSIVNIFENSIPSTVARPVHFAATTSAPIINICRNSWQGRAQGTTAQRPILPSTSADAVLYAGQQYFDTTLNKPIFVKNTNPMQWVDVTGTIV